MFEFFNIIASSWSHVPRRWIANVFQALAAITVVFAQHGPGKLPHESCVALEGEYTKYRENYNRNLSFYNELFHMFCKYFIEFSQRNVMRNKKFTGLALWALRDSKLRFPVRPKMHSFEHLILGPLI